MRGLLSAATLAGIAGLIWLLAFDGAGWIAREAAVYQRDFQNSMALALRGVRAGNPGALAVLLGACFAYGFFHAAGPGHGKVLIGGYGLARRVALRRLWVISVFASLGQAVTAILLVYGGLWLFGWTREAVTGLAEEALAPVSYGAIGLIGLWLILRGLRRLTLAPAPAGHAPHPGGHCETCGHRHGPTLEEAGAVQSMREAAALIGGIAVRPCTGALFVLVITWQMGISGAGIAGTFAMALGTAVITVLVATGAVGLRSGMLGTLAGNARALRLASLLEVVAGMFVVVAAWVLLSRVQF